MHVPYVSAYVCMYVHVRKCRMYIGLRTYVYSLNKAQSFNLPVHVHLRTHVHTYIPWRHTGQLVLLAIVTSTAEEDGNALMIPRVQTVHILQGERDTYVRT